MCRTESAAAGNPNVSVKMATVQQKARLWFQESISIVAVENRNCNYPSKNSIECWYEQWEQEMCSMGYVLDDYRSQTKLLSE
ncbi:hypothetical protein AVEN_23509-1 [Araneus ventricosus]|uniref:DUF4817 domain-containing protein n=1 Tax=Araneus ventricosus TaxID=182803 RepID=A0A4Y2QN94_ARAVE|nr:hypothetical protein AVEN_165763-1 [Araneus ventricosus]GBN64685.1 hypothetical protein AVEN_23509-1 [Araneus ventricosus]